MGLSRTHMIAFAGLALVGGAIAVVGFGMPLGALLLIGVLLCCPIMMIGMHSGGPTKPDGTPTVPTGPVPTAPDQGPTSRG